MLIFYIFVMLLNFLNQNLQEFELEFDSKLVPFDSIRLAFGCLFAQLGWTR